MRHEGWRRHIAAFIAGSCYPIMIIPAAIFGQAHRLHPIDLSNPNGIMRPLIIENMPVVNPFYFGLWNVLFLWISGMALAYRGSRNVRYMLGGAMLGFTFATYGAVVHNMPVELFGLPESRWFMPPIMSAILYALVYRFIQQPLNVFLGVDTPSEELRPSPDGESLGRWSMRLVAVGAVFLLVPLIGMTIWMQIFPWEYGG